MKARVEVRLSIRRFHISSNQRFSLSSLRPTFSVSTKFQTAFSPSTFEAASFSFVDECQQGKNGVAKVSLKNSSLESLQEDLQVMTPFKGPSDVSAKWRASLNQVSRSILAIAPASLNAAIREEVETKDLTLPAAWTDVKTSLFRETTLATISERLLPKLVSEATLITPPTPVQLKDESRGQ